MHIFEKKIYEKIYLKNHRKRLENQYELLEFHQAVLANKGFIGNNDIPLNNKYKIVADEK